jgi:hypothetical protein
VVPSAPLIEYAKYCGWKCARRKGRNEFDELDPRRNADARWKNKMLDAEWNNKA